jgi:hypothetical protein
MVRLGQLIDSGISPAKALYQSFIYLTLTTLGGTYLVIGELEGGSGYTRGTPN